MQVLHQHSIAYTLQSAQLHLLMASTRVNDLLPVEADRLDDALGLKLLERAASEGAVQLLRRSIET